MEVSSETSPEDFSLFRSIPDSLDAACSSSSSSGPTPPAISVALKAQPPTSLTVSTSASLAAVVTNDSKSGGVKWTMTCGVSQCRSFSTTATASGDVTAYTAPASVPASATLTAVQPSYSKEIQQLNFVVGSLLVLREFDQRRPIAFKRPLVQ